MNAWIVTWAEPESSNKEIVAVWNYRYNERTIRRLIEELYIVLAGCSVEEKLRYAKNRKNNPYPASDGPYGPINCGHNPWLCARFVKNIRKTENGYRWDEHQPPENMLEQI